MGHSAMIFKDGKKIEEFFKETDVGDSKFAKENNLEYRTGNSLKNHLTYNDKEIAIEICSDHGKQRFEKEPFLELILAYDDRAGFFPRADNDYFARWAVVCDGRKPFAACLKYDPSLERKHGLIKGKRINPSMIQFELNENNVNYY
jgi:hypothetical protein